MVSHTPLLHAAWTWLNSEPADTAIRLRRDGIYPFLSYADLNQPARPLVTLRQSLWLALLLLVVPMAWLG